jgi:hypothetical protein
MWWVVVARPRRNNITPPDKSFNAGFSLVMFKKHMIPCDVPHRVGLEAMLLSDLLRVGAHRYQISQLSFFWPVFENFDKAHFRRHR